MGISHLDSYAAFTGVHMNHSGSGIASRKRKPSVDLNEVPTKRLAGLVGAAIGDQSKEGWLESVRQRCEALRKAGECLPSYYSMFCFLCLTVQHIILVN